MTPPARLDPMTTPTRDAHPRRWVPAFLAAVLAVVLGVFGAGPASAATATAAQNGVGAFSSAAQVVVGASAGVVAGQRLGNSPVLPQIVVATGVAAETAGSAASSTVRVGPGAALENITGGEALRIQNAASRVGQPISLVGSRASGTAGAYSDWDYVITGIRASARHSVSSSLPRGATELGVGRQIDVFTGPLDDALPHLTFFPSGG